MCLYEKDKTYVWGMFLRSPKPRRGPRHTRNRAGVSHGVSHGVSYGVSHGISHGISYGIYNIGCRALRKSPTPLTLMEL